MSHEDIILELVKFVESDPKRDQPRTPGEGAKPGITSSLRVLHRIARELVSKKVTRTYLTTIPS